MDEQTKAKYEAESQRVRTDLKRWESDWARDNGGKKPGREDIKRNQDIAAKYKQYNKLRDIIAGKAAPPPPVKPQLSPKRKRQEATTETPQKRTKQFETPSKVRDTSGDLMNSPAVSRKLFSPAQMSSLGPTPQRDGRVLGLFDLLVEKELNSPLKRERAIGDTDNKAVSTPSKRIRVLDDQSAESLQKTPMSASKRQMLNAWMTPLKAKDKNVLGKSPSSASKRQYETPPFLKRHSFPAALDEKAQADDAPAPLRLPRKPLGRGLSEIVASLRQVEEEKLDDDLEALREAEAAADDDPPSMARSKPAADRAFANYDKLHQEQIGMFDDEAALDSPVEEQLDRDGKPLRIFKKKGQKRTTRKANIKPVRAKRPTTAVRDEFGHDEDDGDEAEDMAGNEAQSDGEFQAGAGQRRAKHPPPAAAAAGPTPGQKETKVKKAARKVNELAHANFRSLKLRNKGSKGGPGYNSKFRRRR